MFEKLKHIPFFIFLLPIFFVLHGVLENFGFIPFKDVSILILYYLALTFVVAGVFWLLLRNKQRTVLITTVFMAFIFFYTPFIDLINKKYPYSFFSKYVFLLSVAILTLGALFIYFKRTKRVFPRLYQFLNIVLIAYVLVDTCWLAVKILFPSDNPFSVSLVTKNNTAPCHSFPKPNVYFLLFDEYASTSSLKEQFKYDNSSLDTFLIKQGFHISRYSNANYNYTPFSMASVLNMSYVKGLKEPGNLRTNDFNNAESLIRNNEVINIFSSLGYQLKIYSIFDLAGHPTTVRQSFLPSKTKLITERTLIARIRKIIMFKLLHKFNVQYFIKQDYYNDLHNNQKFLHLVSKEAEYKSSQPRFIYAHFLMPHSPYIFDAAMRQKPYKQIYYDSHSDQPEAYLEYLPYTNMQLEGLIRHIRKNDPEAVILLCGDHGYRHRINDPKPLFHFQNLNAVYFPDHDYSRWNDKVSFVNEFRIVFNQLFQFNYPLLKDSTIFLSEER